MLIGHGFPFTDRGNESNYLSLNYTADVIQFFGLFIQLRQLILVPASYLKNKVLKAFYNKTTLRFSPGSFQELSDSFKFRAWNCPVLMASGDVDDDPLQIYARTCNPSIFAIQPLS